MTRPRPATDLTTPEDRAAWRRRRDPGLRGWRFAIATNLWSGTSPRLPGTCGSAVALLPCFFLPRAIYTETLLLGVVVATIISVLLARRLTVVKDPGWFVMDETAGMWLAAAWPRTPNFTWLLATFVVFRIFDMTKPPPLRTLERAPGGLGIVLDDLAAGGYALAVMALGRVVLPPG